MVLIISTVKLYLSKGSTKIWIYLYMVLTSNTKLQYKAAENISETTLWSAHMGALARDYESIKKYILTEIGFAKIAIELIY